MQKWWREGYFANSPIGRGKSGYHESSKAGIVLYRSSYEQKAYELLDLDSTVIKYLVEPFSIFYGNNQWYKPDLLVEYCDGRKILIEIKASWNVNSPNTVLKTSAAIEFVSKSSDISEYIIWTENELWPVESKQLKEYI